MGKQIRTPRLRTWETPRRIIREDFPSIPELPIRGGWGYGRESAVIIDRDDPVVAGDRPFNATAIQYVVVEKRIHEELVIFRRKGERFTGIKWKLIDRRTVDGEEGRIYDVLRFDVSALPEADRDRLKAAWEGPDGFRSPGFDAEAHRKRHRDATVHYVAEYWFDITSCHGR